MTPIKKNHVRLFCFALLCFERQQTQNNVLAVARENVDNKSGYKRARARP